jgi:hypothetical protein
MDPAEYYYNKFRDHFSIFWFSLDTKGSCSRLKAHQRQNFWGDRRPSAIARSVNEEGDFFSFRDLITRPDQGLPNHFVDIEHEDHMDFLCALFYTILIDQVMYTHRKVDYFIFQQLTQYPKMDITFGWAGPLNMANPYDIFSENILNSRRLTPEVVCKRFESWANFIVKDLRDFFKKNKIGTTTWVIIRNVMLADYDCIRGAYGTILHKQLAEDL